MRYISRTLEPILRRAAREFPVVVLTGPRQSGKTTLLRRAFGRSHGYVSMEAPDVRSAAVEDPRGFLDLHPPPLILDEVHHSPDLLSYIKERVDLHRDRGGQYLLTGSQNLLLAPKVTESLAGRAAMLRLLPLSFRELAGAPAARLPWERGSGRRGSGAGPRDPWKAFLRGGYPELARGPQRDLTLWHSSYIQTYLERDVRSLRLVGDLSQFQIFLRALAARSAQLLSITELSREIGVAVNTIKAWLSVLEATYQIIILRPYYANLTKRLVKTPKVYFSDVGTLCHLVGLNDPDHARSGPMGSAILETAVVGEVFRSLTHRGLDPQVYFWRTSAGEEVDLLVDTGRALVPIEVKLSATPSRNMARGIEVFRTDFSGKAAKGFVVHPGDLRLPLGPDAMAWPLREL